MKTFFTYFLILFSFSSFCQTNLVQNGSFEDIDSCYGGFAPLGFDVFQWSGCTGWSNPTYASSDLWCNNGVVSTVQPPILPEGYQLPRTGNNLAGLFILEIPSPYYREYIQVQLNDVLKANYYYKLSFYVNTSNNYNATSSLGAYFSSTQISYSLYNELPYQPQIKNNENNFITDTLGWALISGIYKANGGENFVTIGCFSDTSTILLLDNNLDTAWGVYLYIDDVEVTETSYSFFIPNIFTPNNDGSNDVFSPNVVNILEWECFIYNRWGQKVYELNNDVISWDGKTTDGKDVPNGTYYYVFTASIENKKISEKGFITLLR